MGENVTQTGLSTLDKLGSIWLDYQKVKSSVDLERVRSETNVPDRVDALTSSKQVMANAGASINWTYVGLAVAGVLGIVLVSRLAKG